MDGTELLHRLYTNAAGEASQGEGARAIPLDQRDAGAQLSAEGLQGLDDLLRKTQPAGNATAWVVRKFDARAGAPFTCVVASFPDLVHAADHRPGFLNHARLARVKEPSFDAPALVEAAESFPVQEICAVPEKGRLEAYVDQAGVDDRVAVRAVAVSELQALPREQLEEILTALFAGHGQKQRTRFTLRSSQSIETLALAWSALPPSMQRTSSFALEAGDGCPVDAIFTAGVAPLGDLTRKSPAAVPSATLRDCVKRYAALLHDAPASFTAILRNAEVSTVTALDEAVRRATIAAPLASGKGEMQTKKPKSPKGDVPRDEWQPLDADTVAEMKRQYDALEQSLRGYIDQRLAKVESKAPVAPAGASPLASLPPRVWIPLAALLAISLILVGVLLWRRGPVSTPSRAVVESRGVIGEDEDPVTEPETASTPIRETAAMRAVTAASASGRWADALKDFLSVESDVASLAIADAASISPDGKAPLDDFARRVAARADLRPEGRERLRTLLVDAIAAERDPGVKVDGRLGDVDMVELKRRLGVASTRELDAHSEIILRWMVSTQR